jgi:hypothetical protein
MSTGAIIQGLAGTMPVIVNAPTITAHNTIIELHAVNERLTPKTTASVFTPWDSSSSRSCSEFARLSAMPIKNPAGTNHKIIGGI